MRVALSLAVLLWAGGLAAPVRAEEPAPKNVSEAVSRVDAALAADDAEALARVATLRHPDPWQVARRLLRASRFDDAAAFAAAVPAARRGTLSAQVKAWREAPETQAVSDALTGVARAFEAKDSAKIRKIFEAAKPTTPIMRISLRYWFASALWMEGKFAACQAHRDETARQAAELGWLGAAADLASGAAAAAYRVRDFTAARELRARAWTSAQAGIVPTRHPYYLRTLADTYFRTGDTAKALRMAEDALRRSEKLANRTDIYRSEDQIGHYARESGDLVRARRAYARVLEIARAMKNVRLEIRTIVNLCSVLRDMGALTEALALLEHARTLAERGGADEFHADVLRRSASVYERQGRFAMAVRAYRRSLELARARNDRRRIGWALHGLGGARTSVGDTDGAIRDLREAIEIKTALQDDRGTSRSLSLLGNAYAIAGRYEEARSAMDLSLSLKRRLGQAHSLSAGLVNRAHLFLRLGRLEDAKRDVEEALALKRKTRDAAGESIALGLSGRLAYLAGKHDDARRILEDALALSTGTGSTLASSAARVTLVQVLLAQEKPADARTHIEAGFAEREGILAGLEDAHALYQQAQFDVFVTLGLRVAAALEDAEMAFQVIERGRASALLAALGGRHALGENAFPATLRDAEKQARLAEHRALQQLTLALADRNQTGVSAARAALEQARAALRQAVARIQDEAKAAANVVFPTPIALADLQGALPENASYVAYQLGKDGSHAVVVTRKAARLVALPPAKEIAATLATLRFDAPPAFHAKAQAALRAQLIEPLGLGKTTRLLISPDGPLLRVPFAALRPEAALTYVPSATVWSRLREGCTRCGTEILAVGDPAYAANSTFGGVPLKRIPRTRAEATAIGNTLLLGPDATEPALRAALGKRAQWRAVHLACHGLMNPKTSTESALALAPAKTGDGRLTVFEVFRMRVPADLVTLSACETGLGTIQSGAGVAGFTRAFMFAGAPRVLVSQWMVDDEATRALMTRFYALWQEKEGDALRRTSEALREAQRWMRAQPKYAHPYYWAGWSLWGVGD